MKNKIYFVHDLLCSLCYGFQPIMREVILNYQELFDFEFVACGLFIGKNIRPFKESFPNNTDYRVAYQKVIDTTGADIRPAYFDGLIERDNYMLNSQITAIGFEVYKNMVGYAPLCWINYHKYFQDLIYRFGYDPNEKKIYWEVAKKLGLNADLFVEKMMEDIYRKSAEQDFEKTRKVFHNKRLPSLYMVKGGGYLNIISGYEKQVDVLNKIEHYLKS